MQTFIDFWESVQRYRLKTTHHYAILKEYFDCANGCGAKGGIDVPDSIWGCYIGAACNNHDIEWELSECLEDLVDANLNFRTNMETIIDKESSNRVIQWMRLKTMSRYYRMVKIVGTQSYAEERGFI